LLPSWNDTPVKAAIVNFVEAAATDGDPGYIPPARRIAVFDNDGTLWSEKPFYHQFFFAMDRARKLSGQDPEWAATPALKAAAAADACYEVIGGMPAVINGVDVAFIDDNERKRLASCATSASARSSSAAIRTATSRWRNGPLRAKGRTWPSSSTIPMPNANSPMIATVWPVRSTAASTRRPSAAGILVDMARDWNKVWPE